jgi:hypothetical protein
VAELKSRLEFCSEVERRNERSIAFLASHFYDISERELDSVSFRFFSEIVSDPNVGFGTNEDSLFDIISHRTASDSRYFSHFEFVRFDHVSTWDFQASDWICDCINYHIIWLSALGLWVTFRNRLLLSVQSGKRDERFPEPDLAGSRTETPNSSGL